MNKKKNKRIKPISVIIYEYVITSVVIRFLFFYLNIDEISELEI